MSKKKPPAAAPEPAVTPAPEGPPPEGAAAQPDGGDADPTAQLAAEFEPEIAPPPPAAFNVLAFLGDLMVNRGGLYLTPGRGFAASGSGSFYTAEGVALMVEQGDAVLEPTGGRYGSVKITAQGRETYMRLRREPLPAEG